MSHGAAGFAYALAALAAASGRDAFAQAAAECIAFEDSSYDGAHKNWPDLRGSAPAWPCQWCHGAPGIGLARLATRQRGIMDAAMLTADIGHAVEGVTRGWPGRRRYALLRHARQRRIPVRGRRGARARRSWHARGAATDRGSAERGGERRLSLETAENGSSTWGSSAALPASATRRCANRSRAAQCADLGIAGYGQVAVTSALNMSKACTRT